jgi:hypothetical protein
VNTGDIAHTPGVLRLLEVHLPEVNVILWPNSVDRGVEPMLRRSFPNVKLVKGKTDDAGKPSTPELAEAFAAADLMLHGSGPSVVAQVQLEAWRKTAGKPYGIYGVTVQSLDAKLRDLLSNAAFVFCRETKSVANLEDAGVTCPVKAFAPDGTFAFHLLDDERALPFMEAHGLEDGKFLCAVPRLRYTPYHQIRKSGWSDEEIRKKTAVNDQYKEADHAKLREAITTWVRATGFKALVCPEMTYQLDILEPLVIDPLPADVKPHVVKRDTYWLPDEAGSVYKRARAVLSFECHSPIIACAHGTPGFYLRQPTDTIKGQMWHDVGLSDWTFEIDETEGRQIARRLMDVHADYDAALATLDRATQLVKQRQVESMQVVRRALGL